MTNAQKTQRRKRKKKAKADWKCKSCETRLFIKGGYGGTELCGPCCTGDASTIEEVGETW